MSSEESHAAGHKPAACKKSKLPPPVHEEEAKVPRNVGKPKREEAQEESSSRPIQLVKINRDTGKFQVCEEGLRTLQKIEGNLGIVAFTGLYRTGKSFTLNLLLDKVGKGVRCLPHTIIP